MNRTLALKLGYLALLAALGTLAWWVLVFAFPGRIGLGLLVLAPVLLGPGRVQGFYYRDLFRGRRLLDVGRPAEAQGPLRAFLAQVEAHPWQKRLLWLGWSVYTTDVTAMVWNNLGGAHTHLGEWSEARSAFEQALRLDPKYPLPHVNLARLAVAEGDRDAATQHLERAAALGYRGTSVDRLTREVQTLLARIEGRAPLPPAP